MEIEKFYKFRDVQKKMFPKEYTFLLNKETHRLVKDYLKELTTGVLTPGKYLGEAIDLCPVDLEDMDRGLFLELLIRTKKPQIFAESEIRGEAFDWNQIELKILGDVTFISDVKVFDNGEWTNPSIHETPLDATLCFVPGALLKGKIQTPDFNHVKYMVDGVAQFCASNLYSLLKRRLEPIFKWINNDVMKRWHDTPIIQNRKRAIVTVPGIGCGYFAGPWVGKIAPVIEQVLRDIFSDTGYKKYPGIECVWFDPHTQMRKKNHDFIGGTHIITNPSGVVGGPSQLSNPEAFGKGDDYWFRTCRLYSLVAWDHVSWPGNDFYTMDRHSDDGVKAAATDVMTRITGLSGYYDKETNKYTPNPDYTQWIEGVENEPVMVDLQVVDHLQII